MHATCTAAIGYVLAAQWAIWWPALLAGFLHFVVVRALSRSSSSARRWIVRQLIVLTGLFALATFSDLSSRTQLHTFYEWPDEIVIGVTAFLLTVQFGAQFMTAAIRPFADASGEDIVPGFPSGGKVIGQYERFLIFVFVMISSPTAIGFLAASKSIFRFGDLKDASSRKSAEYILIGTLMSFSYALVVSYAMKHLLHLVP